MRTKAETDWSTRARDLCVGTAAVIGSIAIPLAGLEAADRQHRQGLARQYVELGVGVLRSPESASKPQLTQWAIAVVNRYGEVPLSGEAARQLGQVKIPVAVPCAVDPGHATPHPDTAAALSAAPDLAERVKLLLAGRLTRDARIAELEAAMAGCR